MSTTATGEAHARLRAAHEKGYRFPEGFLGFEGDVAVTVASDADVSHLKGRVTIGGPRAIEVKTDDDPATAQWVRQELASMAGHRWPTSYEAGDGRYELTIGEDDGHPLGVLLTFANDPFSSSYRLIGDRISQVARAMGAIRFTITMLRHIETSDGRTLPAEFTVSYWNTEENRLTRVDAYQDVYAEVDGVLVPASRTVVTAEDGGFTTRALTLSDVVLLTEPFVVTEDRPERHGTRAG